MTIKAQFLTLGATALLMSIVFGEMSVWAVASLTLATLMGLVAATFNGWLQLLWFERFVTVPIVRVIRFFSPDPLHSIYLQNWEIRSGGHHETD